MHTPVYDNRGCRSIEFDCEYFRSWQRREVELVHARASPTALGLYGDDGPRSDVGGQRQRVARDVSRRVGHGLFQSGVETASDAGSMNGVLPPRTLRSR